MKHLKHHLSRLIARLAAVTVGAGIVDMGMIVSIGTGLLVETGPAQPLSSAKITTKYKSGRVSFSSAKEFFMEEIPRKRV